MKVTVLAGASFCTPALFAGMRGEFAGCEFALAARSERKLEKVTRAARLVAGPGAPMITSHVCDAESSAPALEGADVVIIQMRIGNMPGRAFDEAFPLDYGLCGDEGLGAGGMSAAWRSWPQVEPWLAMIARHAPKALVLMLSSPVGILTRAARVRFPQLNCLGICEVPYVALRDIGSAVGVDMAAMSFDYLGVNHIGWLYGVRAGDRDLIGEWAARKEDDKFPSRALMREWGGLPTKYLRLHFETEKVIAAQRAAVPPRARQLESLQQSALSLYTTAGERQIRELLAGRETPWYADSILPLLRGLRHGRVDGPLFLSGPNLGQTSSRLADDILEIGCRVQDGTIVRIPQTSSPPPLIAGMIGEFCLHERFATAAVIAQDARLMCSALEQHPWVKRAAVARASLPQDITERILVGNAAFAPDDRIAK